MGIADFQAYGSNLCYSRFSIRLVIGLEKSVLIPIYTQLPSCGYVYEIIKVLSLFSLLIGEHNSSYICVFVCIFCSCLAIDSYSGIINLVILNWYQEQGSKGL